MVGTHNVLGLGRYQKHYVIYLECLCAHVIQQTVLQVGNEISKRCKQRGDEIFSALTLGQTHVDRAKDGNSKQHKANYRENIEIQAVFLGNRTKHLISVHICYYKKYCSDTCSSNTLCHITLGINT